MKLLTDTKLDFTDVLLLPKRSEYVSRSEATLERTFKFKYSQHTWTGLPIMVSNMDTTGTIEIALEMQKHKMLTCLHKYYTCDDLTKAILDKNLDRNYFAVSTGIREDDLARLDKIVTQIKPIFICIDVANGYMTKFIKTCNLIRSKYPTEIGRAHV